MTLSQSQINECKNSLGVTYNLLSALVILAEAECVKKWVRGKKRLRQVLESGEGLGVGDDDDNDDDDGGDVDEDTPPPSSSVMSLSQSLIQLRRRSCQRFHSLTTVKCTWPD